MHDSLTKKGGYELVSFKSYVEISTAPEVQAQCLFMFRGV